MENNERFCIKCGRKFVPVGREVICPDCKAQAAEDAKRAAVLKAKTKSWTGESVPVRISGRASTVIRAYGAEKRLPFAAALDELLKQSACFKGMQMAWEDITPYKSRRRDKAAADKAAADFLHGKQEAPQASKQAAKVASKAVKATSKATSKPQEAKKAVKTAAGKG